jgi:hypothetical protein
MHVTGSTPYSRVFPQLVLAAALVKHVTANPGGGFRADYAAAAVQCCHTALSRDSVHTAYGMLHP